MKLGKRLSLRTKQVLRHMTPRHVVRSRITRSTLRRFAEKVGLVYFGYVDQRDDDHRLVRGHTVSSTHADNHYCVGSIRGYDVVLVARNDTIRAKHSQTYERCHWLIATVDLHTRYELPHFYIGHGSRRSAFEASFGQLIPLQIGTFGTYPHDFTSNYTVYGMASHALEIEQIIVPGVAGVIASHFRSASIEIEDNCLYLYIESQHPSEEVLEKLISNALWLADTLDTALAPRLDESPTPYAA